MKVLLDTNICIYLIKRQPVSVLKHVMEFQIGDIGISSITFAELQYGVAKSAYYEKNAKALEQFVTPLEVVPFDGHAAQVYGTIRAVLEKAGTPIGSMDMLIAAHALSLDLPLVTNNTREFERISGLTLLNWA